MARTSTLTTKLAAAALVAGLLVGGSGAAALAATSPERPPASAACKAAAHKLADLKRLDARLRAEYRNLLKLRAVAERNGNDELVAKLDAKLAKARAAHAKVVAQLKVAAGEVRERCAPTTDAA